MIDLSLSFSVILKNNLQWNGIESCNFFTHFTVHFTVISVYNKFYMVEYLETLQQPLMY